MGKKDDASVIIRIATAALIALVIIFIIASVVLK